MVLFSDLLDEFSAIWALILFLPFFALKRHQRPLPHVVGGLEPFRGSTTEGASKQRRRPLSFWLFLCAYLLAAVCLYTARQTSARTLILVDQSLSALRAGIAPPSDGTHHRELGSASESILPSDIVHALEQVSSDQYVTVWTDLPAPKTLPLWVRWMNPSPEQPEEILAVLLQAQPVNGQQWRVHWALQEHVVASVQCGEWDSGSLVGMEGTLLVPVPDLENEIFLAIDGERVAADSPGGRLVLPEVNIEIPGYANPAWNDAALAVWPSTWLSSGVERSLVLNRQAIDLSELWSQLPWRREPLPDEIAHFAKVLRDAIQAQNPSRDAREYLPQSAGPAVAINLPASRDLGRPHLPSWIQIAGWLSLLCASFAWFYIPREGERVHSEV